MNFLIIFWEFFLEFFGKYFWDLWFGDLETFCEFFENSIRILCESLGNSLGILLKLFGDVRLWGSECEDVDFG